MPRAHDLKLNDLIEHLVKQADALQSFYKAVAEADLRLTIVADDTTGVAVATFTAPIATLNSLAVKVAVWVETFK